MPLIYDPVLDQWIESDTGETTQRQGERTPPPEDRQPPPDDREPPSQDEEAPTRPDVPDDGQKHDVDYWDANNQRWYKTEMDLKDTKTNIGGKEVNIPGVKTANETTPMLYRIDGVILEKPDKLRPHEGFENTDYEDNLPATLPPGYKKKEKKEEKESPESKTTGAATIKVGRDTDNPEEIPLTESLVKLRDSKNEVDQRLYKVLVNEGIDSFNRAVDAENFVRQQETSREGRLIAKTEAEYREELRKIDPLLVGIYDKGGEDAVNKEFDRREEEWIAKLPEKYQVIARDKGPDAAVAAIDTDVKKQDMALKLLDNYKTPSGDYNLSEFLADQKKLVYVDKSGIAKGPKGQLTDRAKEALLLNAGFDPASVKSLVDESKIGIPKQIWRAMTPWEESKGEKATPKKAAVMAAETLLPAVYTVGHWNRLSPGEKAAYIAIDAATAIPLAGAAARGARLVSVTGRAATLSRLGGAARGLGAEALAQLKAPINVVIHPVGTAKTTVRELANAVENVLDIKKLPEASVSNIYHTLKLRAADVTNPAEAKAMSDLLVETAAQSRDKRVAVQVGDQVLEIERSPLARETGGLASGTPFGEKLGKDKIVVGEQGLAAEGMYFSPTAAPRFTEATSGGAVGKKRSIIIIGPETSKAIKSSNKLYQGTAEFEGILPPKTEVYIKQRLYTRIGPTSQYTELLLENPLSLKQIAKLKAEGLAEIIKQPFTPAVKISPKGNPASPGLTKQQTNKLAKAIASSGNTYSANALRRAYNVVSAQRAAAPQLSRFLGKVSQKELNAARARVKERMGLARPVTRVRVPERVTRTTRADRTERIGRPDRITRTDRVTRQGRASRIDRTERVSRAERVERADRTDRAERIERIDKTERIERIDKPERIERIDKIGRIDKVNRIDRIDIIRRPPRITIPKTNKQDKAVRRLIATSKGAIAWRQGELNGKDRWDVITNIYRPGSEQYVIVLGKQPQGVSAVVKGPGSARRTAQFIYGKQPLKQTSIINQPGLFTTRIDPITGQKVRLDFVRDADISGKSPSISQKGSIFPLAGRDQK